VAGSERTSVVLGIRNACFFAKQFDFDCLTFYSGTVRIVRIIRSEGKRVKSYRRNIWEEKN
jgi:cytidylate kinase